MSILLEKLDEAILMVLNEVDSVDMPNVYALKSSEDGLNSLIKMVRVAVIKQHLGIYEALESLENEFTEI
jgi:hypothetical protein